MNFNYTIKQKRFAGTPSETEVTEPNIEKIIVHAVVALAVLILLTNTFGTVSAGERGVKTRLGAVVGIVPQGLYVKIPFIEGVVKMDVRTQSFVSSQEEPLMGASNDLQDTRMAVVVNYHIDPTTVADIYAQYGNAERYYHQVVDPLIIATLKAVASRYTASEQIQKRAEMSAIALDELHKAFEGRNVAIEKADITNIEFSDAFTLAIEAKVTAVQNAEAEKNRLEQVKYEAQQTIEKAKAEAESIRIQAQAITQQGGEDYVQLKAIEKWNGTLPAQMIPNASVPFLNLTK